MTKEADIKQSNPKDAIGSTKIPYSTLSCPVLAEVAVGMGDGACKYGRHNYRVIGVRASIYYDAAQRHLQAYWEGEDIDPDSGISHVSKVMSCLMVLRDAQLRGLVYDDRPPAMLGFVPALNDKFKEITERYYEHKQPYTHEDADPVMYGEFL